MQVRRFSVALACSLLLTVAASPPAMAASDAGNPVTCDDYAAGTGYTLDGYLATYDPAVWGRTRVPSGLMEDARRAAQQKQGPRIQIRIGSNTTIIGVGDDPRIFGFNLFTNNVSNLIIRNLTMVDAFDRFPLWDPTDGATGNWNSQYDNISFRGVVHGWVDHVAFTDGDHADSLQPIYFGRPFQVHATVSAGASFSPLTHPQGPP
jgi:pectate lyase